jgi:hypothetical protein
MKLTIMTVGIMALDIQCYCAECRKQALNVECCYTECHYAEKRSDECRGAITLAMEFSVETKLSKKVIKCEQKNCGYKINLFWPLTTSVL